MSLELIQSNYYQAGSYILVSYDKNYRTYLETMGIPWYVVPIILAA